MQLNSLTCSVLLLLLHACPLSLQVSYDADVGVLSPGDTYGVRWRPAGGRAAAVPQLEPVAGQPECYRMRVSKGQKQGKGLLVTADAWLAPTPF
jgi:hypothetical protein